MMFDENTMVELEQLMRLLEEAETINAELHEIHSKLLMIRNEKMEMIRKAESADAEELDGILHKIDEQQQRLVELDKRNTACSLRNKQVGLEMGWLLQKHPEWGQ